MSLGARLKRPIASSAFSLLGFVHLLIKSDNFRATFAVEKKERRESKNALFCGFFFSWLEGTFFLLGGNRVFIQIKA